MPFCAKGSKKKKKKKVFQLFFVLFKRKAGKDVRTAQRQVIPDVKTSRCKPFKEEKQPVKSRRRSGEGCRTCTQWQRPLKGNKRKESRDILTLDYVCVSSFLLLE